MKKENIITNEIYKIIATAIFVGGLSITIYGCAGMNFGFTEDTFDIFDERFVTAYVTTSPRNARLLLTNLNTGPGPSATSSTSPATVLYSPNLSRGAYLTISYPGYKTRIIHLNKVTKQIHVVLDPQDDNDKCLALFSFSRGHQDVLNLPDLNYVIKDRAKFFSLINEGLKQNLKSPPDLDLECSEDFEKPYAANIITPRNK